MMTADVVSAPVSRVRRIGSSARARTLAEASGNPAVNRIGRINSPDMFVAGTLPEHGGVRRHLAGAW